MVKHTQLTLGLTADKLFECVWPFYGVGRVNSKSNKSREIKSTIAISLNTLKPPPKIDHPFPIKPPSKNNFSTLLRPPILQNCWNVFTPSLARIRGSSQLQSFFTFLSARSYRESIRYGWSVWVFREIFNRSGSKIQRYTGKVKIFWII